MSEIAKRSVGHAAGVQRAKLPLAYFLKAAWAKQSKESSLGRVRQL